VHPWGAVLGPWLELVHLLNLHMLLHRWVRVLVRLLWRLLLHTGLRMLFDQRAHLLIGLRSHLLDMLMVGLQMRMQELLCARVRALGELRGAMVDLQMLGRRRAPSRIVLQLHLRVLLPRNLFPELLSPGACAGLAREVLARVPTLAARPRLHLHLLL